MPGCYGGFPNEASPQRKHTTGISKHFQASFTSLSLLAINRYMYLVDGVVLASEIEYFYMISVL